LRVEYIIIECAFVQVEEYKLINRLIP